MFARASVALVIVLALSSFALAQSKPVDVTVELSSSSIGVGQTATLSVYAQVIGQAAMAGNGIAAWDVDLLFSNISVVGGAVPANIDRTGWDMESIFSSSGSAVANGINAIYDTSLDDTERGIASRVKLFSINLTGLAEGLTTITIAPDYTSASNAIDSDFVLWGNVLAGAGGNYGAASTTLTVVPEPASMTLLVLSGLGVLARRRRK